jgi:hypothetical protein
MFNKGIDLKSLGIWNLVITVLVLLVRLAENPAAMYAQSLWAMPLLTMGLGLFLIFRSTNQWDKGGAVLRARLMLFAGTILFIALKFSAFDDVRLMYSYWAVSLMLLVALLWYFIRWYVRKSVLI